MNTFFYTPLSPCQLWYDTQLVAMAEAFGIAAGVLQVAGFGAELGGALWRCARTYRNADKQLEAIAKQVETTALSLRKVDDLMKEPATQALHTPKLFEDTKTVSKNCLDVFQELDNAVKAYELNSTSRKSRIFPRAKWIFNSDRIVELGTLLQHYQAVLHLMVSVMTIVETRRAAYVQPMALII